MANKKAAVADEVVADEVVSSVLPITLTELIDMAIEASKSQTLHSQIAERLNEAKRFIV